MTSMRARASGWVKGVVATGLVLGCVAAEAETARRRRPMRRSPPPTRWEPVARGAFEANAFTLLDGERPVDFSTPAPPTPPPPPPDEEFDRVDLMRRLKRCYGAIDGMVDVPKNSPQVGQAADEIDLMARQLAADPDFSTEGPYVAHATAMSQAARRLKLAIGTARHDEAREALRGVRQACDACHAKFNP